MYLIGNALVKSWKKRCLSVPNFKAQALAAGIAGEYQWGLDAGDHQDAWNPYDGLPYHWIHADRLENDDEKVSNTWKFKLL